MYLDTYNTLKNQSEGIYKDKGSKFLSFAFPVKHEQQIKDHLQDLRKTYYDARHHCYAYALGPTRDAYRINDDGEPSGTAGKPIYGQILSADITNVLLVVVRYFGGVKLGVRGLINAYKAASMDAINNNVIQEKTIKEIYELQFEYPRLNDVMKIIKEHNLEVASQNFNISCSLMFSVRKSHAEKIITTLDALQGINTIYKYTM